MAAFEAGEGGIEGLERRDSKGFGRREGGRRGGRRDSKRVGRREKGWGGGFSGNPYSKSMEGVLVSWGTL